MAQVLATLRLERRCGGLTGECEQDPACEFLISVGRGDGIRIRFAPDASGVGALQLAELYGDGGRMLKVGNWRRGTAILGSYFGPPRFPASRRFPARPAHSLKVLRRIHERGLSVLAASPTRGAGWHKSMPRSRRAR